MGVFVFLFYSYVERWNQVGLLKLSFLEMKGLEF
jgi:hypothetical protein